MIRANPPFRWLTDSQELVEREPCTRGALEDAILLAETKAFNRRSQQGPVRRFLE